MKDESDRHIGSGIGGIVDYVRVCLTVTICQVFNVVVNGVSAVIIL